METARDGGWKQGLLPEGTRIGPWRVVRWHGQGAHGVLYQAVQVRSPWPSPVALKLALAPEDPRFAREVTLLTRLHHPCIPRLLGHGHWRHPAGTRHPFIALEWVEGPSLYDWARERNPSSRQVLLLLAQLARALQAIHSAHAVHRDVKGGNILVRASDDRPVLTDFGSGDYQGSERLTWRSMPPLTRAYRSPEASRFAFRFIHEPESHYVARPSDDVFSLGVTAYRLLTGLYPPTQLHSVEAPAWSPEDAGPWSLRSLNPRMAPALGALVLRMLSPQPEARGTAQELAEALEFAAARAGTEADLPLFAPSLLPRERPPPSNLAPSWARVPKSLLRLTSLAVGLFLLLWLGQTVFQRADVSLLRRQAPAEAGTSEAGNVAVGDGSLTAPGASQQALSASGGIALELPSKPLPGQHKPDANNRCPRKGQTAIHGGCWVQLAMDAETCAANGADGYVYKGRCYAPAFPPRRQPTSTQTPNARP
ncbi:Serine/threonine protein kinase [Stigmatella aurantiaca]|uniref:Serine/threonine protein kinase n=1 Tax=Stigmatella aurantiaca TaxID=41 RepID=A0A1H7HJ06_STIAU|nr:serine/threonine-protein kinase [Stigmatella aurantiaca]SEK50386.1 Serine/threonine protein kinase [Stigmatella aurantiaca]